MGPFRTILIGICVLVASSAHAAVLDAVAEAGLGERAVPGSWLWQNANTGGIAVEVSGGYIGPGNRGFGYFKPGEGLGVCNNVDIPIAEANTLDGLICGADAPLQSLEILRLVFPAQPVTISDLTFGFAGGQGATVDIKIVGQGGYVRMTLAEAQAAVFSEVSRIDIRHSGPDLFLRSATLSAVPLPISGAALLTGIAAFGLVRRRRR